MYLHKKQLLEELLSEYLNGEKSLNELQKFSWEMVDYFNKTLKSQLPPYNDFEKEFWYAIWQIQHLADEEHEKDGITKKTLREGLGYLKGQQEIPENCYGLRP